MTLTRKTYSFYRSRPSNEGDTDENRRKRVYSFVTPEPKELEPQAPPTSSFNYHDLTYDPVLLVQFNNSLSDSSGNNFHLTFDTGSRIDYGQMYPSAPVIGARLNGAVRLQHTGTTLLQISGNITIEFLARLMGTPNTGAIVTYTSGQTDVSSPSNYLYWLAIKPDKSLWWFHEYNTGLDQEFTSDFSASQIVKPIGTLQHIASTRIDNVVRFYIDGVHISTSQTMSASNGGSTARLYVGGTGGPGVSERFCGDMYISSLKIVGRGLTSDEIYEEYMRTIGQHPGPFWI